MKRVWVVMLSSAALAASLPDSRLVDAEKKLDRAAVRDLLKRKVDVNAPAVDGSTALHWAAYGDDLETAALLIAAGANAKAENRYQVTPLSLACENGNAAMIELLLKAGADPNTALPEGESVLMTASRSGNLNAVKMLIAHGATVNTKENGRGQTSLMWAAAEGHVGVVRALLKAGASPNETLQAPARQGPREDGYAAGATAGSSALVLAVANAHFELASMLLDAGADPNAAKQGWTALHTITWVRKPGTGSNDPAPQGSGKMSSLDFVRKMASRDANLNAKMTVRKNVGLSNLNTIGATPFLLAARTGDAELMRLLAKLGADPKMANADNTTPLMVAAGIGTRSPGEDAGTESEALEAVQVALELGGDVNAVDSRGDTAIHGAAYKHLPSVAQFLIDNGAKVDIWNQKDRSGWTPLRIADGVHRGMNLRSSPETAVVLRKALSAAGLSTVAEPEINISGATR